MAPTRTATAAASSTSPRERTSPRTPSAATSAQPDQATTVRPATELRTAPEASKPRSTVSAVVLRDCGPFRCERPEGPRRRSLPGMAGPLDAARSGFRLESAQPCAARRGRGCSEGGERSGGGGERSDAGERLDEAALPGPACGQVKRPPSCRACEAAGDCEQPAADRPGRAWGRVLHAEHAGPALKVVG